MINRASALFLAGLLPCIALAGSFPASVKVDLSDPGPSFSGPGSDPLNANCLACHSADMVFTQPTLSKAAWQAEVTKMIKVYKAPVTEEDIPAIVDYLANLKPPQP